MNVTERDPTSPDTSPAGDEAAGIWDAVLLARAWLDEHNGTAPPEIGLRVLKIVEEAGEAAAAWIGVVGNNPRKGVTHTEQDVADELGDVAFTALVAAASLGHDPREVLAGVAGKVRARLTDPSRRVGQKRPASGEPRRGTGGGPRRQP